MVIEMNNNTEVNKQSETTPHLTQKAYNKNKTTHILKPTCKFCGKVVDVIKRNKVGNKELLTLSCKHKLITDTLETVELDFFDTFISHRNETLLPFQKVGAKFAIDANGRCLIADEMGLGKTVQALAINKCLEEAIKNSTLPALYVVKASLTTQWAMQGYNWCGEEFALIRVIRDARYDRPQLTVCPITIVSYESLIRMDWFGTFNKEGAYIRNDKNCDKFKLVILDECQQIKNRNSKRAKAIKEITKNTPHIIALSGTPIKNNAAEYFSILNILKPERFNNFNHFTYKYVDTIKESRYGTKYGGITSYALKRFHEDTKDFIIRRTQDEVMPELPKVRRDYKYYELGEEVEEAYVNLIKEFQKEGKKGIDDMNIIAYLNRMRVLTGLAKVEPTVDHILEFLENNAGTVDDDGNFIPPKKIAIFTHHHDAARLIRKKLIANEEYKKFKYDEPVITIEGESDKFDAVEAWRLNDNCPVFIGTTLACGEGLNMQFCSYAIIVEREWNPANEEQTEKRFPRIGIDKSISKITVVYPTAIGTVDEFFAEIVEKKRAWMKGALDNVEVKWEESNLIKELAEKIMINGGQKWGF